jgi:AcrR family transcriptional regulator
MTTRRRISPGERKTEILDAAALLIGQHGYNRISVQQVADAAGITKSGLLHHFADKDTLLLELLKSRDRRAFDPDSIPRLSLLGPVESRRLIDTIVLGNSRDRELVRLFVILQTEALSAEHPAHAYFTRRLEVVRAALVEVLSAFHSRPENAALRVIVFLDGLQLLWLQDESIAYDALWTEFADGIFGES